MSWYPRSSAAVQVASAFKSILIFKLNNLHAFTRFWKVVCRWIVGLLYLYALSGLSYAQLPNPGQYTGTPSASYGGSNIDPINLSNGALSINVPLFSYPQKGGKILSYSLKGQLSSDYGPRKDCDRNSNTCTIYYMTTTPILGPLISLDQKVTLTRPDSKIGSSTTTFTYGSDPLDTSSTTDYYETITREAIDSHNVAHYLGFDSSYSDFTILHSLDGSGYYAILPNSTSYQNLDVYGVLYDSQGTRYESNPTTNTYSISDSNGNVIYHEDSTGNATDSFGRQLLTYTEASSQDLAKCPNLGLPTQPLTGASIASFAGPGGSNNRINLIICSTQFYYQTNLLGGIPGTPPQDQIDNMWTQGGPPTTEIYNEVGGQWTQIQSIVYPDGSYWAFTYDAAPAQFPTPEAYGDLTSIRLPTGAIINYTYQTNQSCLTGSPDFHGWNNTNLVPYIPFARTVSTRTITGVPGAPLEWDYTLTNTSGSMKTTVSKPDGNSSVYTFNTLGGSSVPDCSAVETNRKEYQGRVGAQNTTLLRNTDTAYYSYTNPAAFPELSALQGASAVSNFPHTVTTTTSGGTPVTTTYTYDAGFTANQPVCVFAGNPPACNWGMLLSFPEIYGLQKSVQTSGSDGHGSTSTVTTSTNYWWEDHSNYLNQGSSTLTENLISLPESVTVTGSGGNSVTTSYGYDASGQGPTGVHGNATSVTVTGTQSGTNTTLSNFNSNGQATAITQNGVQTSYTYGDNSSPYPTVATRPSTNGVVHADTYTWDPNTSAMTSWIDENGVQTTYAYGGPLGQLSLVDRAIGTAVESETQIDTSNPNIIVERVDQNVKGDGLEVTTKMIDGLNRVVSVQDPAGNSTDTVYDSVGNVQSVSNPHASSPSPTDGITSFAYDALGRKTFQCQPDDTTSHTVCNSSTKGNSYQEWDYSGDTVAFHDELNHIWTRTSDAFGRLASVTEPNGAVTNYSYDSIGNLLQVNQLGNSGDTPRTRIFSYDSLSRLLHACNPESIKDFESCSNSGIWSTSYVYDANGNLSTKTDARNITTTYSYDALNRLTGKTYSDVTPPVSYSYDINCRNTIYCKGRMSLSSVGGASPYAKIQPIWDALGREAEFAIIPPDSTGNGLVPWIGGSGSSYDLAGHVIRRDSIQGAYYYITRDAAGRPTTAYGENGTTGFDANHIASHIIFENGTFTPFGAPSTRLFGSSIVETRTYDKRGRQTSITQAMPGTSVSYNNTTSYDAAGNVTAVNDSVNGNWTYTYDSLNRLHTASSSTGLNMDWEYDSFGNRLSQTPSGTGTAPTATSFSYNANNHVTGSGITYDAAGNVTTDSLGQTYSYDAEGRISSMNQPLGGSATYKYDPNGDLIYISGPSGAYYLTHYETGELSTIYPYVNQVPPYGNWQVYIDGENVGRWYDSSFNWYGKDSVGTIRFRTFGYGDPATNTMPPLVSSTSVSFPYGETTTTGIRPDPMQFTGKERDQESGLDHFEFRSYASTMGRWMSPDPRGNSVADFANPQSWNMYSYVLNNPLKYVDPFGLDCAYLNDAGNGIESSDRSSSIGECGKTGGYWVSGAVNSLNVDSSGGYHFGNNSVGADGTLQVTVYDKYLGPNTDNSLSSAYGAASGLLSDFLTGNGPDVRNYDLSTVEGRNILQSKGIQQLNARIKAGCASGQQSGPVNLSSGQAAANIPYDAANSPVGGQVGGYGGGSYTNNGDSTDISFTNVAGAHSFVYHATPDRPSGSTGPGRSITQNFTLSEPNPCTHP